MHLTNLFTGLKVIFEHLLQLSHQELVLPLDEVAKLLAVLFIRFYEKVSSNYSLLRDKNIFYVALFVFRT